MSRKPPDYSAMSIEELERIVRRHPLDKKDANPKALFALSVTLIKSLPDGYKADAHDPVQKRIFNLTLRAAEQGHASAQYNLGWSYSNGIGVKQNRSKPPSGGQKPLNKGLLSPNIILAGAILMEMVSSRIGRKLSIGGYRLPNKVMLTHNIILEIFFIMVTAFHKTSRKLPSGGHRLLNKVMLTHNIILGIAITRDMALNEISYKLPIG